MELSKLLIKAMYLALVFVLVYFILKLQTPLVGLNLMLFTLFTSVIVVYFTFGMVYNFLVNREIVIKDKDASTTAEDDATTAANDDVENEDEDEDEETTTTKVTKSFNRFVSNHMHKYIKDDVFQ